VLAEIMKMEQRYDVVLTVIRDGFSVREVADKFAVSRESVHLARPLRVGPPLAGYSASQSSLTAQSAEL